MASMICLPYITVHVDFRFIGNKASLRGGAIFVDKGSSLELDGVHLENSDDQISIMADMIHSVGNVLINDASFYVKPDSMFL